MGRSERLLDRMMEFQQKLEILLRVVELVDDEKFLRMTELSE